MPDATSKTSTTLPYLPNEILLNIFGHFLPLPNGIHSDRWPTIYGMRVKPYLIGRLVPVIEETIYKRNRVYIAPVPEKNLLSFKILYPKPAVNHFVRELEVRLEYRLGDTWKDDTLLRLQIEWLQKLAQGKIGFRNLEVLKIVITGRAKQDHDNHNTPSFAVFFDKLKAICPLRFRIKKLELVIHGHSCPHNCRSGPDPNFSDPCEEYRFLKSNISIHQDPIQDIKEQEGKERGCCDDDCEGSTINKAFT